MIFQDWIIFIFPPFMVMFVAPEEENLKTQIKFKFSSPNLYEIDVLYFKNSMISLLHPLLLQLWPQEGEKFKTHIKFRLSDSKSNRIDISIIEIRSFLF